MVTIKPRGSDSHAVGRALQTFRRKLDDAGTLDEYRERQSFTKPSEKRRKAKQDAIRRARRGDRPERWYVRAMDGTVYHNGDVVEPEKRKRGKRGRGKRGKSAT